jgi:hypothetical protein
LTATGGQRAVRLVLRFRRPGFFKAQPTFFAERARACLDCGAVIPFLAEGVRRDLLAEADTLLEVRKPYVDDDPDADGEG